MADVRCPVVVGRQAELAALDAALAAALGGAGRLVFLAGEPGIGKSRLAREVAARARAAGLPWADLGGTAREADVLALIAEGLANKEIAAAVPVAADGGEARGEPAAQDRRAIKDAAARAGG